MIAINLHILISMKSIIVHSVDTLKFVLFQDNNYLYTKYIFIQPMFFQLLCHLPMSCFHRARVSIRLQDSSTSIDAMIIEEPTKKFLQCSALTLTKKVLSLSTSNIYLHNHLYCYI